jgi:hypothetical protein
MTKLKLLGSLVDTIKEQGLGRYSGFYVATPPIEGEEPIGYDYDENEPLTVSDVENFGGVTDEEVEEISKLETFPKKGKCPSWSHLSKNGKKNGDLSSSELQTLKHHTEHQLSVEAAKNFDKLEDKFIQKYGRKITDFTDSYRPYSVQWSIFDYDHCIKTGEFKKINYHTFGVAKPGTSNHGWGEAVDIFDADWQKFAKEHGKKYGWCWGENTSEPHHFTYDLSYCS